MPNFSYGDSCQTGDDKYVIAQFRSDASLGWVGELRAFLVKDELKYKWFNPERHRVRSRPELWKRVETGVHQAEITIIDPHVYRDFAIGEFLEQQAIPGIDFDLRTINELSGRYIIDDSPLGSVEAFDKDWPFDRTLRKDKGTFTSASLRQRAGGKLKDAVIVAARSHAMISPSELTELIGSCRSPEGQLARWKRISDMNWTFDVEHPKSLPILNEFSERLAHAAGLPGSDIARWGDCL